MPQNDGDTLGTFDLTSKAQFSGYLLRRTDPSSGGKWQKRFCIIKDGYLLCYKEEDALRMRKLKIFVHKSQASIPLSECFFREVNEPGHPFSILIENSDFLSGGIVVGAESEHNRTQWLSALKEASKISFQVSCMTDRFIQQLDNQVVAMASDTDRYKNLINEGAEALESEKQKNETLQRLKSELEKEKLEMEEYIQGLQEEQENIRKEMEETLSVMLSLQADKSSLERHTHRLESDLERLERERKETEAQLRASPPERELTRKLAQIQEQSASLQREKTEVEARLIEKENLSKILEEEKRKFSDQARELQDSMRDLLRQKEKTERDLQAEMEARLAAERRLHEAELSLSRLHANITEGGNNYSTETKEEMTTDVRKLKSEFNFYTRRLKNYFENLIEANASSATQNHPSGARSECLTGAERSLMVRARSLRLREKHRSRLSTLACPASTATLEEESTA